MPTMPITPSPNEKEKLRVIPTAAAVLAEGRLAELVFGPSERRTQFVVGDADGWSYEAEITHAKTKLVPYSPGNNLLVHEVVLLPSEPEEYGSDAELLGRIRAFIHHYVDVSPLFEELSAYYVLLSWLYDSFHELPYLRVKGDFGSGKTRFLLVVGSLCYKPIFASGASTTSPLFRIMDAFRGTLILDESDFRLSDERAEIVKILNNGNAKGFPVLRTEVTRSKEFDPRAYTVYGPKIVATRGYFEDRALESRCLTEEMGQGKLRDDIPLNLDDRYRDEARHLRNQLLRYRLRNWQRSRAVGTFPEQTIEPRLKQIFAPFLSLIADEGARERAIELLKSYQKELMSERSLALEARVLEAIVALVTPGTDSVRILQIAKFIEERFPEDFDRPVTPKWVSSLIRKRLGLKPEKSRGVFVLMRHELAKLPPLLQKYGIEDSGDKREAA